MPRRREHKPGSGDVADLELILRQPPAERGAYYGDSAWAAAAREYCARTGMSAEAIRARFPDRWPDSRENAIAAGQRHRAALESGKSTYEALVAEHTPPHGPCTCKRCQRGDRPWSDGV